VACEIVRVVDLPFGKRPFRDHVDPSEDGAEIVNAMAERMRREMYRKGTNPSPADPHFRLSSDSATGFASAGVDAYDHRGKRRRLSGAMDISAPMPAMTVGPGTAVFPKSGRSRDRAGTS
jgi:hypothetical protein